MRGLGALKVNSEIKQVVVAFLLLLYGVSIIPFFLLHFPALNVMSILGIFFSVAILPQKKLSYNIIAPVSFYIIMFFLILLTQLATYGAANIYKAGAMSFFVLLGACLLRLNHKTVSFVLDIFLWVILLLMTLEGLIKANVIILQSVDEMLRQVPQYRWDVFRLTAFHGTPLLLSPTAVFFLFRELRGPRRPLFIFLIWLMIFLTGSRSALLVGVFIHIMSLQKFTNFFKYGLPAAIGTYGIYIFSALIGYDAIAATVQRSLEGFDLIELLSQDESVAGRRNTSLAAIINATEDFQSIVMGVAEPITSDSAIASIAQQSGIVLTFILYLTLFFLSLKFLRITDAIIFIVVVTLLSLSVGGALAPTPFFVVLLIFIESYTNSHYPDRTCGSSSRPARLLPGNN